MSIEEVFLLQDCGHDFGGEDSSEYDGVQKNTEGNPNNDSKISRGNADIVNHGLCLENEGGVDCESYEQGKECGCDLCCLIRTSNILEVAGVQGVEAVVIAEEEDGKEDSRDENEE